MKYLNNRIIIVLTRTLIAKKYTQIKITSFNTLQYSNRLYNTFGLISER